MKVSRAQIRRFISESVLDQDFGFQGGLNREIQDQLRPHFESGMLSGQLSKYSGLQMIRSMLQRGYYFDSMGRKAAVSSQDQVSLQKILKDLTGSQMSYADQRTDHERSTSVRLEDLQRRARREQQMAQQALANGDMETAGMYRQQLQWTVEEIRKHGGQPFRAIAENRRAKKITRRQLRKLFNESMYAPQGVG